MCDAIIHADFSALHGTCGFPTGLYDICTYVTNTVFLSNILTKGHEHVINYNN